MDDTADTPPAAQPGPPAGPVRAARPRLVVLLLTTAVAVLTCDQLAKAWALRSLDPDATPRSVVDGWLQFRLVFNSGAAFNLGTGSTWIFTIIATVVAVVILRTARRIGSAGWAAALGLLLGGAVGNLSDRFFRQPGFARGHVVDFIEYQRFPFMEFPVFNVADASIVTAAILIALLGFRGVGLDGSRLVDAQRGTAPGA